MPQGGGVVVVKYRLTFRYKDRPTHFASVEADDFLAALQQVYERAKREGLLIPADTVTIRRVSMYPMTELNEPVLPDDYPIYGMYCYVVDGKVVRSDWHDITVADYKRRTGASEIRRCDMVARGIA